MASSSGTSKPNDGEGLPVPEPEKKLHVLAVDDAPTDRFLIKTFLQISNCQVTTVESGKRALEVLGLDKDGDGDGSPNKEAKVDMVITDYFMPEMTGFDLLKRMKESPKLKEIPVVIMSSENDQTRISRCLEEGAQEFLIKPVRKEDVSRLVTSLLMK